MLDERVLDVSPVPPPVVRREPRGIRFDFFRIVEEAEMINVITHPALPEIRVHGGQEHFKVPRPGRFVYCISGPNLPSGQKERAREMIRILAYGFLDWASREVVSRYHRDLKRVASPRSNSTMSDFPASVKIRRFLRQYPNATIDEIAAGTGVAQSNVSRQVSLWKNEGVVGV